jgi:hypothetical protein
MARRNLVKKQDLQGANEHFEPVFNTASAASVNF